MSRLFKSLSPSLSLIVRYPLILLVFSLVGTTFSLFFFASSHPILHIRFTTGISRFGCSLFAAISALTCNLRETNASIPTMSRSLTGSKEVKKLWKTTRLGKKLEN